MDGVCDSITKVETLVVFDIEATGLPNPRNQPKIMEFTMMAVNRNELLSPHGKPRIINKLQICVNPRKPIPPIVSQITGIFNDHLESQQIFDLDLVNLINGFLNRLSKPVCLIAHNGHGYDFPLLMAQIRKVSGTLSEHVLCSDSLVAFRDLAGEEPWDSHKPYLLPKTKSCETVVSVIDKHNSPSVTMQSMPSANHIHETSPMDLQQGLDPLNLQDHGVAIDENMNLSSAVLPNQNIHMNNNNEQMEDLEIVRSTQENQIVDLEEENNSLDRCLDDDSEEEVNIQPAEGGQNSPVFDEEDMNFDPMYFKYSNENTPVKMPDKASWAPRKHNPPKTRVNPGTTRRQLNFDTEVSPELKDKETPKQKSMPESHVNLGQTKRRLNFDTQDLSFNAFGNKDSCNHFEKINNCQSTAKRVCVGDSSLEPVSGAGKNNHLPSDDQEGQAFASSNLDSDIKSIENQIALNETPKSSRSQSKLATGIASNEQIASTSQNTVPETPKSTTKLSYGLENLYARVFGGAPDVSHTSEDDCINLLKLIKKHSPDFISWIDSHNILFNDVKPLY